MVITYLSKSVLENYTTRCQLIQIGRKNRIAIASQTGSQIVNYNVKEVEPKC